MATLTADPFVHPTTPTPTGVSLNSNTGNNRFYSFDDGLTHFLVFSAEAYVYARDAAFLANQLAFMKADLAAVNRSATPWVVALVHKDWTMGAEGAFYCARRCGARCARLCDPNAPARAPRP